MTRVGFLGATEHEPINFCSKKGFNMPAHLGYAYFEKPYEAPVIDKQEVERLANLIEAAEQVNATLDVLPKDVQSQYDNQYKRLVAEIDRLKKKV
jgi:hypothetical protein